MHTLIRGPNITTTKPQKGIHVHAHTLHKLGQHKKKHTQNDRNHSAMGKLDRVRVHTHTQCMMCVCVHSDICIDSELPCSRNLFVFESIFSNRMFGTKKSTRKIKEYRCLSSEYCLVQVCYTANRCLAGGNLHAVRQKSIHIFSKCLFDVLADSFHCVAYGYIISFEECPPVNVRRPL